MRPPGSARLGSSSLSARPPWRMGRGLTRCACIALASKARLDGAAEVAHGQPRSGYKNAGPMTTVAEARSASTTPATDAAIAGDAQGPRV